MKLLYFRYMGFKIFLGTIILLLAGIFIIYGTLDPCGILEKEIANQAGKSGDGQAMYVFFGGFVERGIDTLTPMQCISGWYKVKTEGVDAAMRELFH